MSTEPGSTPPPIGPLPPPLTPRPPRAPVPGWMWLLFTAGLVAAGGLLGAATGVGEHHTLADTGKGLLGGAVIGLCNAPLFAGGLALSGRFFQGTGARIVGTLMFVGLLLVGLGAVAFAGCLCLMQSNSSMFH